MCKTELFLLSSLKSDDAIMFLDPNFLFNLGITAICKHYRQKLANSCLHGFSEPSVPKWRFWGQNRGRGGAVLTPQMNLFLLFGTVTWLPLLAKISQEMQP